jgi:adenylosuccinate lyase
MIERYTHPEIARIFSDEHKLNLWQKTELAVIHAQVDLQIIEYSIEQDIRQIWDNQPIDLAWWKNRDTEIHHDLNAFIDERVRHLPTNLHQFVHKKITSYDTEEPAFGRLLREANDCLDQLICKLEVTLENLAKKYRFTIMNARTHGQEAELQSFGARVLTWLVEYRIAIEDWRHSLHRLKYSKLSGAIGKYGSLNPQIEKIALEILGFIPLYGTTQIMPRILYTPIAQSLSNLLAVLDKIANDIRLMARSSHPLVQEPFKKKQKGSSAMPHKKNTIRCEQIEGLAQLASGYADTISHNIKTWEERSIEQSSVERVAWPDLFHTVAQALKVLNGVLTGLQVYPDNMLAEVYESRGVYASSEVKEFLKDHLPELSYEDVYRIVQLASFNVFEPSLERLAIRDSIAGSLIDSRYLLKMETGLAPSAETIVSIRDFIPQAKLRPTDSLDISPQQVVNYNQALRNLFFVPTVRQHWSAIFTPEFLLKNEGKLYQEILNC